MLSRPLEFNLDPHPGNQFQVVLASTYFTVSTTVSEFYFFVIVGTLMEITS